MTRRSASAGYEPHSALPFALQIVFSNMSPIKPPGLGAIHILGTTAVCMLAEGSLLLCCVHGLLLLLHMCKSYSCMLFSGSVSHLAYWLRL